MFIVIGNETGKELVSSIYWKLKEENLLISISGNVILRENENCFKIKSKIFEESSAKNFANLFKEIDGEKEEILKSLIESLERLALIKNDQEASSLEYEIFFQNSVIINDKKEYPMIILKSCYLELIEKITSNSLSRNEKLNLILQNPNSNEMFLNEKIYKTFRDFEDGDGDEMEFGKIVQQINFELIGLSLEEVEKINLKDLKGIFNEILNERKPNQKLEKLVQFGSVLTESSAASASAMNADALLPILTYVIVKITDEAARNISGEVKFIERFCSESDLSGLNGYILTSINAAIEIVKTIYREDIKSKSEPTTHNALSSIISSIASIGQVPKAIATSISSTWTRSPKLQSQEETELALFRERMMATNSSNDLVLRDISILLEDYKNLLYLIYKS